MQAIFERHFGDIKDPRCQCDVKHRLVDVLVLVMCAVLCGYDELEAVVDYGHEKSGFLRERFGMERIPSKSTLTRIMNMVDAEELSARIINIMRELVGAEGETVAVDGKTIRSTCKGDGHRDRLHIVTAYLTESGVCLGQLAVGEKTNEIPVARELLGMIDMKGRTVTMDAMHCQTETARKIVEGGGDYVLCLKDNQRTLLDDVRLYMEDCMGDMRTDMETASSMERNGGRTEKRVCRKAPDISWLDRADAWQDLKNVFSIYRWTSSGGAQREETSYYMTSLDASSEDFLRIVRGHWAIESMHWMLDVVFSEDECRILSTNGQKGMNIFRKLALALHRSHIAGLEQRTKPSIRQNMRRALMNDERLLAVVGCRPVINLS